MVAVGCIFMKGKGGLCEGNNGLLTEEEGKKMKGGCAEERSEYVKKKAYGKEARIITEASDRKKKKRPRNRKSQIAKVMALEKMRIMEKLRERK